MPHSKCLPPEEFNVLAETVVDFMEEMVLVGQNLSRQRGYVTVPVDMSRAWTTATAKGPQPLNNSLCELGQLPHLSLRFLLSNK